jgi:hypothetical protein
MKLLKDLLELCEISNMVPVREQSFSLPLTHLKPVSIDRVAQRLGEMNKVYRKYRGGLEIFRQAQVSYEDGTLAHLCDLYEKESGLRGSGRSLYKLMNLFNQDGKGISIGRMNEAKDSWVLEQDDKLIHKAGCIINSPNMPVKEYNELVPDLNNWLFKVGFVREGTARLIQLKNEITDNE